MDKILGIKKTLDNSEPSIGPVVTRDQQTETDALDLIEILSSYPLENLSPDKLRKAKDIIQKLVLLSKMRDHPSELAASGRSGKLENKKSAQQAAVQRAEAVRSRRCARSVYSSRSAAEAIGSQRQSKNMEDRAKLNANMKSASIKDKLKVDSKPVKYLPNSDIIQKELDFEPAMKRNLELLSSFAVSSEITIQRVTQETEKLKRNNKVPKVEISVSQLKSRSQSINEDDDDFEPAMKRNLELLSSFTASSEITIQRVTQETEKLKRNNNVPKPEISVSQLKSRSQSIDEDNDDFEPAMKRNLELLSSFAVSSEITIQRVTQETEKLKRNNNAPKSEISVSQLKSRSQSIDEDNDDFEPAMKRNLELLSSFAVSSEITIQRVTQKTEKLKRNNNVPKPEISVSQLKSRSQSIDEDNDDFEPAMKKNLELLSSFAVSSEITIQRVTQETEKLKRNNNVPKSEISVSQLKSRSQSIDEDDDDFEPAMKKNLELLSSFTASSEITIQRVTQETEKLKRNNNVPRPEISVSQLKSRSQSIDEDNDDFEPAMKRNLELLSSFAVSSEITIQRVTQKTEKLKRNNNVPKPEISVSQLKSRSQSIDEDNDNFEPAMNRNLELLSSFAVSSEITIQRVTQETEKLKRNNNVPKSEISVSQLKSRSQSINEDDDDFEPAMKKNLVLLSSFAISSEITIQRVTQETEKLKRNNNVSKPEISLSQLKSRCQSIDSSIDKAKSNYTKTLQKRINEDDKHIFEPAKMLGRETNKRKITVALKSTKKDKKTKHDFLVETPVKLEHVNNIKEYILPPAEIIESTVSEVEENNENETKSKDNLYILPQVEVPPDKPINLVQDSLENNEEKIDIPQNKNQEFDFTNELAMPKSSFKLKLHPGFYPHNKVNKPAEKVKKMADLNIPPLNLSSESEESSDDEDGRPITQDLNNILSNSEYLVNQDMTENTMLDLKSDLDLPQHPIITSITESLNSIEPLLNRMDKPEKLLCIANLAFMNNFSDSSPLLENPAVDHNTTNNTLNSTIDVNQKINQDNKVDEIWKNFYKSNPQYSSLPYPLCAMKYEVAYSIIMADHDYCQRAEKPILVELPPDWNDDKLEETSGIEKKVEVKSFEKKVKYPKMKTRLSRNSSSSSSDSSSASSDSSSSSSDSSDTDSDSSGEDLEAKSEHEVISKSPQPPRVPEVVEKSNEEPEPVKAEEEPEHNIVEPEDSPIRESELETDETSSDEEFYDSQPQLKVNKLIVEKRHQLIQAAGFTNNGNLPPAFIVGSASPHLPYSLTPVKSPVFTPPIASLSKSKLRCKRIRKSVPKIKVPIKKPAHILCQYLTTPKSFSSYPQYQDLKPQVHNSPFTPTDNTPSGSENNSSTSFKRRRIPNTSGYSSGEEENKTSIKWRKLEHKITTSTPMIVPHPMPTPPHVPTLENTTNSSQNCD